MYSVLDQFDELVQDDRRQEYQQRKQAVGKLIIRSSKRIAIVLSLASLLTISFLLYAMQVKSTSEAKIEVLESELAACQAS